jgi:hypothetical protein
VQGGLGPKRGHRKELSQALVKNHRFRLPFLSYDAIIFCYRADFLQLRCTYLPQGKRQRAQVRVTTETPYELRIPLYPTLPLIMIMLLSRSCFYITSTLQFPAAMCTLKLELLVTRT